MASDNGQLVAHKVGGIKSLGGHTGGVAG